MEVSVENVERDTAFRAWEITLEITRDGVRGFYLFYIGDVEWREARTNAGRQIHRSHESQLLIEKPKHYFDPNDDSRAVLVEDAVDKGVSAG